jgi:hypothetical protein
MLDRPSDLVIKLMTDESVPALGVSRFPQRAPPEILACRVR